LLKRLYTDPSFILLLAINIYCIIYYHQNPSGFASIVWLYWFQSVLIGVFNFADMITVRNPDNDIIDSNTGKKTSKGCASFFFLVHYQGFHFGYAIFILTMIRGKVDGLFLLLGIAAFAVNQIVQFVRHKRDEKQRSVSLSTMMFLPYLRIVPMHLMILGPVFLHWQASDIFLILKTVADCLMFMIASPYGNLAKQPASL
jgi:hypothetical protein